MPTFLYKSYLFNVSATVCAKLMCQSLSEMLSVVIVVPQISSPSRSQLFSFFSGMKTRLNAIKHLELMCGQAFSGMPVLLAFIKTWACRILRLTVNCFYMGNFLGFHSISVILLGSFGQLTVNPSCNLWAAQLCCLEAFIKGFMFCRKHRWITCERMRHYRIWRDSHFSGTGRIRTGRRYVQQLPSGVIGSRWKGMEASGFQAGDGQTSVESRGTWLEWQPTAQGPIRARKEWGSWKQKNSAEEL